MDVSKTFRGGFFLNALNALNVKKRMISGSSRCAWPQSRALTFAGVADAECRALAARSRQAARRKEGPSALWRPCGTTCLAGVNRSDPGWRQQGLTPYSVERGPTDAGRASSSPFSRIVKSGAPCRRRRLLFRRRDQIGRKRGAGACRTNRTQQRCGGFFARLMCCRITEWTQ
jgi:hypothetical protein